MLSYYNVTLHQLLLGYIWVYLYFLIFSPEGIEIKTGDGITYIDDYKPKVGTGENAGGPKIIALMSGEIGGSNCMEPLAVGAELGLPVADCDFMGRAFPELQVLHPLQQ